MDITIGCDPEFFLADEKGKPVSAFGLIPGTKMHPHKVKGGAIQVDGMAVEFNTVPTDNEDEFVHNIDTVLKELRKRVPKEYQFLFSSAVNFPKDYMDEQPDLAKMLGCDPDFNAYTGVENPTPKEHPTMRTAAGHIHIGWDHKNSKTFDLQHRLECIELTVALDTYLALPALLLGDVGPRRTMYGMAGSFRPKPYGMEYRVLGNFWLKYPNTMKAVFKRVKEVFDRVATGNIRYNYNHASHFINNGDTRYLREYLQDMGIKPLGV